MKAHQMMGPERVILEAINRVKKKQTPETERLGINGLLKYTSKHQV